MDQLASPGIKKLILKIVMCSYQAGLKIIFNLILCVLPRNFIGGDFGPMSSKLVSFVALRPKSTAMVIAGRSVHLTTLFSWASLNKQLTSNRAHTFACN